MGANMTRVETIEEGSSYPLRVATRITGLKAELLRAWEARYDAVRPRRTEGGARRYSQADIDRLKLLRDVVEAGQRIGNVARLGLEELRALLPTPIGLEGNPVEQIIAAAEQLDGVEVRRRLELAVSTLDPVEFGTEVALPFLYEIGERWKRGELSVSAEHLGTAIVRSILMALIDPAEPPGGSTKFIFATPSGEPHDLGTLVAALVASRAGANVTFLGADVPAADLVDCAVSARASVLVLGLVTLPKERSEPALKEIRGQLPGACGIWIGGAGIAGLAPVQGVERIDNLGQLEAHLAHLDLVRGADATTRDSHEKENP
jgi:DNA-binding transcriptional MerR regulator/methylmalonyl-CoA mutase cobalamin-binding subunit